MTSYLGSSPCVWGQAVPSDTSKCKCWIIPMRVGTSLKSVYNAPNGEDHPHACGDKNRPLCLYVLLWGSSPCVWGQDNNTCIISAICRIIPMRVGTSPAVQIKRDNNTDHPHACGDKALHTSHCPHSLGSSPCVWGQAGLRCQKR